MSPPGETEKVTREGKNKHVLLIDDDLGVLESYKEFLAANGCIVSTSTSGTDALKQLKQMEVGAIFCDLMMPNMTGDMFYRAVQRVKPQLCSRFVFITGYQGHPQFEEFFKREKLTVLYKPVTPDKLIAALDAVLKQPMAVKKG